MYERRLRSAHGNLGLYRNTKVEIYYPYALSGRTFGFRDGGAIGRSLSDSGQKVRQQ